MEVADARFEDSLREWMRYLSSDDLSLVIKQACDNQGFINTTAAKAMGLTIPRFLLIRVDRVIE